MEKKIKYIGYYDTQVNEQENRNHSLAAVNKMNYICKALNSNGFKVLIVSTSKTSNKKFYKSKQVKLENDIELKLFPTLPWGNKIQKAISLFAADLILFLYLITRVKKNENIIVYHSLAYKNIINTAKKIKKFKIILEVEEIYQYVINCSKLSRKAELNSFKNSDKFIFSTEKLNKTIDINSKPYIVIYGTYLIEKERGVSFNDNKIHVVYAGSLDPRKGCLAVIKAADFLHSKYHVHILGVGSEEQIGNMEKSVRSVNEKIKATVTYDGVLKGEEFVRFLQKCHVGLCTQDSKASYNETSFPSKILSYLANGLRVVSIRIKAIETSDISSLLYFYNNDNPQEIAETIKAINFSTPYDSRKILEELDKQFVKSISDIIRN